MKHGIVLATAAALALLSACAPYSYSDGYYGRDGYYGDGSYGDGYYSNGYYGTAGGPYANGYRDRYGRPAQNGPGYAPYGRYRYDGGYRRY